jgi:putative addiction module component (TIGR02574 family)
MTKLFRQTVEQIEKLPDSEQDAAAGAIMDYLEHRRGLTLTDEQAAEVRRRLADPRPGVPLEDVRKIFRIETR